MNDLMQLPAFEYYVLAAAFTVIKLVTLAFSTIFVRTGSKSTTLPEDSKLFKTELVTGEVAAVDRVQRAHRNALENEIPFMIIGLIYVLTGASARGAAIYFGVVVGARLLHTVFYLAKAQPWRSLMFAVAALGLVGMSVGSVLHVLR